MSSLQFSRDFEADASRADSVRSRIALSGIRALRPSLRCTGVRYETGERSALHDCYLLGTINNNDQLPCDANELHQLAVFRIITGVRSWFIGGGMPSRAYDNVTEATLGNAVSFVMKLVAAHTVGGEDTMLLAVDLLRRYVALPGWRYIEDDVDSDDDSDDSDNGTLKNVVGWANVTDGDGEESDRSRLRRERQVRQQQRTSTPPSPVTPPGVVLRPQSYRFGANNRKPTPVYIGDLTPLRTAIQDVSTAHVYAPSLIVFDIDSLDADLIAAAFACVRLSMLGNDTTELSDAFFMDVVHGEVSTASNLRRIFGVDSNALVLDALNERYWHAVSRVHRSTPALSMYSASLSSLFDAVDLLHWLDERTRVPRLLTVPANTLRILRTAFTLFVHYAQLDAVMAAAPWYSAAAISHALRAFELTIRQHRNTGVNFAASRYRLPVSDSLVGALSTLAQYDLNIPLSSMTDVVYVDNNAHSSRRFIEDVYRRLMIGIDQLRNQQPAVYDATLHAYLMRSGPDDRESVRDPVSAIVQSANDWRWYTLPSPRDIAIVEAYVSAMARNFTIEENDNDMYGKRQRI